MAKRMKIGNTVGYAFGYFLFTTILYFILKWLNKIPETWNYFYIMGITFSIILVGGIIKKILR